MWPPICQIFGLTFGGGSIDIVFFFIMKTIILFIGTIFFTPCNV